MKDQISNLLDLLQRWNNPGPQPKLNEYRPVRPEERPGLGIDSRDPNKYDIGPDGQLVGTLIGWSKTPNNMQEIVSSVAGKPAQPVKPGMVIDGGANMIPRANRNGLIRVSPGVYRNRDGGLVYKIKG